MTDDTQADVEVTQADRDAAADAYATYFDDGSLGFIIEQMASGEEDADWLIQAFAKHRLTTLQTGREQALEEAWRPIESAPKDQTVLLYRPTGPSWNMVAPGNWQDQKHHKRPKPYWKSRLSIASVIEDRAHPPTHWQPLPKPPALKKDQTS